MSDFDKFTFAVDSLIAPSSIRVVKCSVRDMPNATRPYVATEHGDMDFVDSRFLFDTEEEAEAARQDAVIDMFHSLKICWNCKHVDSYAPDMSCNKNKSVPNPSYEMYGTCKLWESQEESESTDEH